MGHQQPGLRGERDEPFDNVEAAFVGEVLDDAAATPLPLGQRRPDRSGPACALLPWVVQRSKTAAEPADPEAEAPVWVVGFGTGSGWQVISHLA